MEEPAGGADASPVREDAHRGAVEAATEASAAVDGGREPFDESAPSPSIPRHADADAAGGDVHNMLATADARQKTFQAIRDVSLEIGVRDTRRCDYPMENVFRAASAHGKCRTRLAQPTADGDDTNAPPGGKTLGENLRGDSDAFEWRRHLESHVAQLMMELRFKPDQLKVFLSAHYPKQDDQDNGDSSDDEEIVEKPERKSDGNESRRKASSIHDISPFQMQRHLRKFLSVKDVYKKLTEIAFQLGEALYQRTRQMLLKSVRNGVIDRSANLIRLESMFKLELRRQVTIERLEQAVLNTQENYRAERRKARKRRQMKKRQNSVINGDDTDASKLAIDPTQDRLDALSTPAMTAHQFKMHALERMLASEWKVRDLDAVMSLVPQRPDQFEDLIQEKVTSVIYSKSRENFPFWKDPPEHALSREETTKLLRVVVSAFSYIPMFSSLNVDQLIEVAKYFRWKSLEEGAAVCTKNCCMEQFFIVMEGQLSAESGIEVLATLSRRRSSRLDDRRSVDSAIEHRRAFFGEIGLLSKTETWPFTLSVKSAHAKLLILTRDAFDNALSKIFWSSKRQVNSKEVAAGKRPASSPASTRLPTRLVITRPASSAIRDTAVAKSHEYRDRYLQQASDKITEEIVGPISTTEESIASKEQIAAVITSPSAKRVQPKSIYQNYPSFPIANGSSPGSHMFRLKCIQPIAFGMKDVEDLIHDEWAPAFPDTGTLVDYMSTVDSFLFEKRNVLVKSNLRGVCTNLPFQDDLTVKSRADEYLGFYQDAQAEPQQEGWTQASSVSSADPTNAATVSIGLPFQSIATGIEGESMTLNQFVDARKRVFGRVGTSLGGAPSPSMRNVFASNATSATLAKTGHAPFVNSSFVPESSFVNSIRPVSRAQLKAGEDFGSGVETQNRPESSTEPEVDEVDESDDSDSQHETRAEGPESASEQTILSRSTNARKMALDSLVQSMSANSASKKKVLDGEAARRVILQRHLFAANQGDPVAPAPTPTRKSSTRSAGVQARDVIAASHAPLPLRVDLQRRMEVVLAALKMKPKAKLDLVLKYTHADHYDLFADAVVLWEQAMHYIQKREKALEALRSFELVASDPRRHFRSLSTHRLAEQKERDGLFYQLNYASDLCRESLDELDKRCGDVVFVDGRLYRDKMKKDYTELLYEVEKVRLKMIYKDVHPVVGNQCHDLRVVLNGNQQDDRPLQNHVLSGVNSAPTGPRYALSTPNESIFVSVVDRRAQEERDERQSLLNQVVQDGAPKRPLHKLANQVQQHRQAQLDELTTKRDSQPPATTRPTTSLARGTSQLRSASLATPPPSTRDSLKKALESVLRRR